jgi:hypothetical protein
VFTPQIFVIPVQAVEIVILRRVVEIVIPAKAVEIVIPAKAGIHVDVESQNGFPITSAPAGRE